MDTAPLDEIFARTLEDGRLSRAERDALRQVVADVDPDARELALLRSRAFALAAERLVDPRDRALLEWCEDVVKALDRSGDGDPPARKTDQAMAAFSPGEDCPRLITRLMNEARRTLDVCVFTITDDRITDAIVATHRRGVAVRVIADDDKAHDLGSDVERLAGAGVPVVVDRSEYHMHHKFALFDGATLLTGSYNWTRSAARNNEENLVVTGDPRLVAPFREQFEALWRGFGGG